MTIQATWVITRNRLSIRQTLNMVPSGTTHLIHDVFDHVIVETNGAGQAVREYIWLGDIPVAVLDGSATPANPTLLWVHVDHLGRPELMTDATKAVKWKALYEPFGTVHSITGAAALQMRFPGQWFQLEAGLAYNWNRHYDSTTGRYTQTDPLGINQGPQPPALSASPPPNAAPGATLAVANDNAAGASSLGTAGGQSGNLPAGLSALQTSRQDGLGLATQTEYAATAGATERATRITRDGASLYGYARQSSAMRFDPKGLFSIAPPFDNPLLKQCTGNPQTCAAALEACYLAGAWEVKDCRLAGLKCYGRAGSNVYTMFGPGLVGYNDF